MTPARASPTPSVAQTLGSRPPRTYAAMTNTRETKFYYARLLLVVAFAVGLLSAFQDWEFVKNDQQVPVGRSYTAVIKAIEIGLYLEYCSLIDNSHGDGSEIINIFWNSRYVISISLLLYWLTPILLARTFSRSRVLWWLWMFAYVSWYALLIHIFNEYSPYVIVKSMGVGASVPQPHLSWLSGFYFGCAALALHLSGMILLFFSRPQRSVG